MRRESRCVLPTQLKMEGELAIGNQSRRRWRNDRSIFIVMVR